jgi:hypothetical protein
MIAEAVAGLASLTAFALDDPTGRMDHWLPDLKPCLRRMRELDLRWKWVSVLGSVDLVKEVFQGHDTLEKVTLAGRLLDDGPESVLSAFVNVVSTLPNLRSLDLSDLSGAMQLFRWDANRRELLDAVEETHLMEVSLPSLNHATSATVKVWDKIYYVCKLRQIQDAKLLALAPLSLWPLIITKLGKGKWLNVLHHLLVEKPEVLLGASLLSAKRKRESDACETPSYERRIDTP